MFLVFSLRNLGKIYFQFDYIIFFKLGWFNHQPVSVWGKSRVGFPTFHRMFLADSPGFDPRVPCWQKLNVLPRLVGEVKPRITWVGQGWSLGLGYQLGFSQLATPLVLGSSSDDFFGQDSRLDAIFCKETKVAFFEVIKDIGVCYNGTPKPPIQTNTFAHGEF